jgi:hypothetical protein
LIPWDRIYTLIAIDFVVFVPPAVVISTTNILGEQQVLGDALMRSFLYLGVFAVYFIASLAAALYTAFVHVSEALCTPTDGPEPADVSRVMLAFQAMALLGLGVEQSLQLGIVPGDSDSIFTIIGAYWLQGNVAVNYFILGAAHIAVLVILAKKKREGGEPRH